MSEYYRFDSVWGEYVKSNMEKDKRYLYDPVTDSYVENIRTTIKERFLHEKYGHYGFQDFYTLLCEVLKEEFPDFECRVISMGDYTFDADYEIINGDVQIRYAPYAMFVLSESVEDTIDSFLKLCKKILVNHGPVLISNVCGVKGSCPVCYCNPDKIVYKEQGMIKKLICPECGFLVDIKDCKGDSLEDLVELWNRKGMYFIQD